MTDQSSKSDLTNSAVLVMLELTDEVAIVKRMHEIDQSSKSHFINRSDNGKCIKYRFLRN